VVVVSKQIFSAMNENLIHTLIDHKSAVLCLTSVCLDADENNEANMTMISGSRDGTIRLWDCTLYECTSTLFGHKSGVLSLATCVDRARNRHYLVSASTDNDVRVWDLTSMSCIALLVGHVGSIFSMRVVGSALFCGCQDCTVKVLNLSLIFDVVSSSSTSVDVSSSTTSIDTNSSSPSLLEIEFDSALVCMKRAHYGLVYALERVDDRLWSASGDGSLLVWSLASMERVARLDGHDGAVLCLAVDSYRVYSGSQDSTVIVWDRETLLPVRTLTRHTDDVLSIDASHRYTLMSLSADRSLVIWEKGSFQTLHQLSFDRVQLSLLALPTRCMTGSRTGAIHCWRLPDIGSSSSSSSSSSSASSSTDRSFLVSSFRGVLPFVSSKSKENDESENSESERENESEKAKKVSPWTKRKATEWMLETLREFVSIRSVSPDPRFREQCLGAAKFVKILLEDSGFEVRLDADDRQRNPLVLARLVVDAKLPTVTVVGHYDVVPAPTKTASKWLNNAPFSMHGEGGYLYGRGVTDNKGPIVAAVCAVRELMASASLACNVNMIIEGEEENGSENFEGAVRRNLDLFADTTHILVANNYWLGDTRPCLTYGMRGVIKMRIEVSGPAGDAHSGVNGGALHEPLVDLVHVLASLVSCDGRVLVPGFYDSVRPIDNVERALTVATEQEFDVDEYRRKWQVDGVMGGRQDAFDVLTRRWRMPTLTVHKVESGKSGGGEVLTSIPHRAVGLISMRTVPDQNHTDIVALVSEHIRSRFKMLLTKNAIQVSVLHAGDWWLASPTCSFFRAAERAIEHVWHEKPLYVREGGTLATTRFLEQLLDAPALHLPLGQSSDSAHLPNERIRLKNLINGKDVIRYLFEHLEP
jgi:di- and tripeptidase